MTIKEFDTQFEKAKKNKGPIQIQCKKKNCRYVCNNQEILSMAGVDKYKEYLRSYNVLNPNKKYRLKVLIAVCFAAGLEIYLLFMIIIVHVNVV